jgi:acyl-CoA synthetase (AMP-forming)/AMP-acid ligase II
MAYNAADMFEYAVDVVGERTAIVCGEVHRTYAELDERANRLANHLLAEGVEPGDHVGIYGLNSVEWMEGLLAVLKARAVPVNINFRYVEAELSYLFDNADLVGLIYSEEFGPRVAAVKGDLPLLRTLVMIEDGSGADQAGLDATPFRTALDGGSPERDFGERSGDDQIIIYTGGTTGMPKGVMWRSEDIFFALAGGIDAFTKERVPSDHHHAERAAASAGQLTMMNTPPLMHGAAFVATLMQLFQGNRAVLVPRFDPTEVWRTIEREKVNAVLIVGDAMGRPLIEALHALDAAGEAPDLSSLISLSSTAAVFSPSVKDQFLERFPNLIMTDSIGSTESGMNGIMAVSKGNTQTSGGGPTVNPSRDTVVLDEALEIVEPGSGVVGMVGRGGNIPLGYYKDAEKTAATFVTAADGKRYAVPGDYATVGADGTITLLGRGSVCINTGGEKVYPEEVEQALKAHDSVFDCVVVGLADERWGQRVTAVVQAREGHTPDLAELDAHTRTFVAAYKVPKELHLVDQIVRSPSGKPDYRWAREIAESGAARLAT